jgi:hypothetical protein
MSVPKACQRPGGSRPAASAISDFNLRTLRKYFIRHLQKPKCDQKHPFCGLVIPCVLDDAQTFIEHVQHIRLGHDAPQGTEIEQKVGETTIGPLMAASSPRLRAGSHKVADMSVKQFTQN